jgi:type IV pilus assembly protein PilY1
MKLFKTWLVTILLTMASIAHAQIPPVPPNVADLKRQPMVVLNMSKDHQLFYRAYNEYTDIDFDGVPDTTYNHSINYYGYFDYSKCYQYDGTKYVPTAVTANKYCAAQWSGNFLNWATMARVDIVRKVLYGGFRSTDTGAQTVLERAYLPSDAHSFAKYYNGADLPQLTPYTAAQVAPRIVAGVFATPVGGITICNTTLGGGGANRYSHTNTNPPLMRVAFGDFSLWNANERWQCYWNEEKGNGAAYNSNQPAITGLPSASFNPVRANMGLPNNGSGPDFIVRVEVCNPALLGTENCTKYPSGNYKPVGLMHEFGAKDQAEFALITGSFSNNISGGVLRRNMNSFMTEINKDTNGAFNAVQGIAYTLNRMRIYGYDYNDGSYAGDIDNGGNWCTYQLTGLVNNQCTSWGNPIGEMYLESLRYLAGKTATPGFAAGPKDAALGLNTEAWIDPYTRPGLSAAARAELELKFGKAQCRPMSVLNFNASAISYDLDNMAGLADLGDGTGNITTLLNKIGADEGINGTQRLVGRVIGGTAAEQNRLCDLKNVNSLANVDGICPDAPGYKGSYSLAGLAYWAHTNRIRTDYPATKKGPLTVDTYSIALNPGTPIINIVAGNGARALIQPAYRLVTGGGVGGGTLVDFRIVTQTPTYGKYLIVWEDSEQGGDYDQDVTGTLEYTVVGNTLSIRTYVFAAATANPQGFGYVISGTDRNGPHFHSGILGFNYNDSTNLPVVSTNPAKLNASGGCQNCQNQDPASTANYNIVGGNLGALPDPLLLAAKWGGFKDDVNSPTKVPGSANRWDVQKQNGSLGSDGVPDNYYVVYRPDLLETALRNVFGKISDSSNASPAVSFPVLNSRIGGLIQKYALTYSSDTLSSQLRSYVQTGTDSFSNVYSYSAGGNLALKTSAQRQIVTNVGQKGVAFTYPAINALPTVGAAYLSNLSGTTTAASTTDLIEYLRGDRTKEQTAGAYRKRPSDTIIGPVINSNPWIQGTPSAALFGKNYPKYEDFIGAQKARTKLIWIGSDDGMLHGFSADNLEPVLSYVPEPIVSNVKKYADPSITSVTALMDGNISTADLHTVSGTPTLADWRTYLFASVGRGGKGIFALDVTDPSSLVQNSASNIFKWQFTSADDADLGYVLSESGINPDTGQPGNVVRMPNGKFAYIMGNGVDSSSGKAALFIVYAEGPNINPVTNTSSWTGQYEKIVLDSGTGNGLMQPFWVDSDDDGVVDTIYAGDLKGNMWKVDVKSPIPSNWKPAYGPDKPLYKATTNNGTALPITGAPAIAFHPAGGVVVVFGTGKSINASDFPNTAVQQRVYGIRDFGYSVSTPPNISNINDLEQRTWTFDTDGNPFQAANTAFDWNLKKGWYANIPYSSGMAIRNMLFAQDGSTDIGIPLIFPTAGNINVPTQVCANDVFGAYLQIDAIKGIQTTESFGPNGQIGYATVDQHFTIVRNNLNDKISQTIVGNSGSKTTLPRNKTTTRLYWREIPGVRTIVEPDTNRQ